MKKKPRCWAVSRIKHPSHPKLTVRVAEWVGGGTVHAFYWEHGKQRSKSLGCRRVDLGSTPKQQVQEARRLGSQFIEGLAQRAQHPSPTEPRGGALTLSALADRYERDGFAGRTPGYKRDALACVRRVAAALGADVPIAAIKPSHLAKYLAQRVAEGHAPAGRRDLVATSIAVNWGIGEGLLEENPLARKPARDAMRTTHDPRRPFATRDRYDALQQVAPRLPPAFAPLLCLAWNTGHRLSALLELKWEHVTLTKTAEAPFGTIRWYADCAKTTKRHEHTLPMNEPAYTALRAWKKRRGAVVGAGWVFPSPRDPKRALEKWAAAPWLREAERLAKIAHMPGGGWHMLRRGWATARKHLPLKDVAAGGGWTDTATVLKSYQHADAEATKAATTFVA